MRWSLLLIAGFAACSSTQQPDDHKVVSPPPKPTPPDPNGPKVVITTPAGDITVESEVVATEASIEQGLMYRQHLAPDAGMLFLLPQDKDWTFWMHNTLIPLDMIFIRKSMTIAGVVENAEPKTDTFRQVHENSSYVLEVNGGWTKAHGVGKDQVVKFLNLPKPQ